MSAKYPNMEVLTYAFDGTLRVDVDDLMYHTGDDAKPATSQADALTEEANQRLFARNFCGVAKERKVVGETAASTVDVVPDWVGEMPCASSAFEVGDLLAIDEAASGTALERQKLVKTTDAGLAIGYCVKREASAVTTVLCRLIARATPYSVGGSVSASGLPRNSSSNIETLAADKTLTVNDAPTQVLDPAGARKVLLPEVGAALAAGATSFWIRNTADAAEVITVKDSTDTLTVGTPTQNESILCILAGGVWYGLVGFHN